MNRENATSLCELLERMPELIERSRKPKKDTSRSGWRRNLVAPSDRVPLEERECKRCGDMFVPHQSIQVCCGMVNVAFSCSWRNRRHIQTGGLKQTERKALSEQLRELVKKHGEEEVAASADVSAEELRQMTAKRRNWGLLTLKVARRIERQYGVKIAAEPGDDEWA